MATKTLRLSVVVLAILFAVSFLFNIALAGGINKNVDFSSGLLGIFVKSPPGNTENFRVGNSPKENNLENNPEINLTIGWLDLPAQQQCNIPTENKNIPTASGLKSHLGLERTIYVENNNTVFIPGETVYIQLPGEKEIIYVKEVVNNQEIIYIYVNGQKKVPCNRGNKVEFCDPGNSAGQGNWPYEKEANK